MSIKNKIIAITLGLSLALAGGTVVAEDLESEISALMQQVAALQEQLADAEGETGETIDADVPAACAGVSFTRNLSQGSVGSDVKCLQALLNTDDMTQVADTGVGSQGNETTYFGALTKAAVINFQAKYASEILTPLGLTAGTGFVGNSTRPVLNEMLEGEVVTEPTDFAAQLAVIAAAVEELAERVKAVEDDVDPVVGQEGTLDASRLASPGNVKLELGDTDEAVYGFKVEAEDSDISVRRVDILLYAEDSIDAAVTRDRDYADIIDNIMLYSEGEEVATLEGVRATFSEDYTITGHGADDQAVRVRFSGLDLNVEDDGERSFEVRVDISDDDNANLEGGSIVITVGDEGIRGVDSAGIDQYNDGQLAVRTFSIDEETADISVSKSSDTPDEGIVIVDEDTYTENVELLIFDLEVENDTVELQDLTINISMTNEDGTESISDVDKYIGNVELLYDGNVVGTESAPEPTDAGEVKFEDIDLELVAGEYEFTVRVEVRDTDSSSLTAGSRIRASLGDAKADVVAEDSEGYTLSIAQLSGSATGEWQYLYEAAPIISNISTSISDRLDKNNAVYAADATIEFTVTAGGAEIQLKPSSIYFTITPTGDETYLTAQYYEVDGEDGASEVIEIAEGDSVDVSLTARVRLASGSDVRTRMIVEELKWDDEDGDSLGSLPDELLQDLRTTTTIIELTGAAS